MSLKTQQSRVYRGLVWVGRIYRFAGWFGLGATAFFTVWVFFHQLRMMWNVTYITRFDVLLQCLLLAFLIAVTGLVLSAVAFGISLFVQVGLTTMQNSQTQIALLRRITQDQSTADSLLRLQDSSPQNVLADESERDAFQSRIDER